MPQPPKYFQAYRAMVMARIKPGHDKRCAKPGCCLHGRRNYNRGYM